MPLPLRVYADNKHFPKNSLRNCTVNYILRFVNQKTKIHVSVPNVLWVAFSIPSGSDEIFSFRSILMKTELEGVNQGT
jgi:hypothetical protein